MSPKNRAFLLAGGLSEPKKLPVQYWRGEPSRKFSTSTGNNFPEFSGIFYQQHASITWCDFFRPNFGQKTQDFISVHDVWEPLKQALLALRDVIISSQICVSKFQKLFTLGDGCWLPILGQFLPVPKCSKSRDLTAIAICDSNRESQITSDLRQCEPSQKSSLFWLVV